MRGTAVLLLLSFQVLFSSASNVGAAMGTYPSGLFSIRSLVNLGDFADLVNAFELEFSRRKEAAFSRPIPQTMNDCLPTLSLYDWAKGEISFLINVSNFGSKHLSGEWKEEFSKRHGEVHFRYVLSSVLSPQEGQRMFIETQTFKALYTKHDALRENITVDELLREKADMREFFHLTAQIEATLARVAAGPEVFRLTGESQSLLANPWGNSIGSGSTSSGSTGSDSLLLSSLLRIVKNRDLVSKKIGYPNDFSENLQGSALGAFERSKGRSTLVSHTLETSPVARFLRAMYQKVIVEGLQSSLSKLREHFTTGHEHSQTGHEHSQTDHEHSPTGHEYSQTGHDYPQALNPPQVRDSVQSSSPVQASDSVQDRAAVPSTRKLSLLQALTGFSIVVKGLLNVAVELDFEEDGWSDSSFVLKLTRPSADPTETGHSAASARWSADHQGQGDYQEQRDHQGDAPSLDEKEVIGRIFVELSATSTSIMRGARPRTRDAPGSPGIVLLSLMHRNGSPCHLSPRSVKSFESCVLASHTVYVMFHELAHALHFLLSDLMLKSSSAIPSSTDYVELPSQLFECLLEIGLIF